MRLLTIALILAGLSTPAKADTDSATHFGVSYALQTTFYGFNRRALRLERVPALGFAAFTTLAIGFTKEYLDALERGDERIDGRDMLYNMLGMGASIGTCLIFEF